VDSLLPKIKHPGVPNFHVQLVGFGSNSSDFVAMENLAKACNKHVKFAQTSDGAVATIFREHFKKVVNSVRQTVQITNYIEEVVIDNGKTMKTVTKSVMTGDNPNSNSKSIQASASPTKQVADNKKAQKSVVPDKGKPCRSCGGLFVDIQKHLAEYPDHKNKK
jgi:hypothetical protein